MVFLVKKWLFLYTKLCEMQCHMWRHGLIRENCCYWLLPFCSHYCSRLSDTTHNHFCETLIPSFWHHLWCYTCLTPTFCTCRFIRTPDTAAPSPVNSSLHSAHAQEAETIQQVPDCWAREGVRQQYVHHQTKEMGTLSGKRNLWQFEF